MFKHRRRWIVAITAVLTCMIGPASDATTPAADALAEGFRLPPRAAAPLVWWHWMNGNATQEGVRADLEWMHRVGIGGVQNIDASTSTPVLVKRPIVYRTPEWRRTFRESVELARGLGMDFDIDSAPGWSLTGGPWVKPSQAMKKLVWSETLVEGGMPFRGRLEQPPRTTGNFQNIPRKVFGKALKLPEHYADVATVAYRVPRTEVPVSELNPTISSSAKGLEVARLSDGDVSTPVYLPASEKELAWIEFAFDRPRRIQAISAVIGEVLVSVGVWEMEARDRAWLEASDDGRAFRKVVALPHAGAPQQTVSFPPVIARIFRVTFERPEGRFGAPASNSHRVAELVLHSGARINRFEDKAGYTTRAILGDDDTSPVTPEDAIHAGDVLDLTSRMRADGSLDWVPPPGRWVVLRFGHSLIGTQNHPASPAGTGLEVDKLSRTHVDAYMESYLRIYEHALGTREWGTRGLTGVHVGSYEAGPQNWTEDMLEQFRRRRGYDARAWFPVLAGRVVGSARASDAFLWDFRQTLGDLMVEGHYEGITVALHRRGMKSYFESYAERRAFQADGMRIKKAADVPMGEMWAQNLPCCEVYTQEAYDADMLEAASVAHLYGKPLVAAESFTTASRPVKPNPFLYADPPLPEAYSMGPSALKPIADRMMIMGVNRFILHTSVHQPLNTPGPGFTLGVFGQWLTRKETWAEQAGTWINYLARSAHLLQQGKFVADVAYLYGEDTSLAGLFFNSRPPVPKGFRFDFVNADALLHELSVSEGDLKTRSGMTYRVLALDPSTSRMSLPVLRKIRDLMAAGAVVVGARPLATPSLADDAEEFQRLAEELWGRGPIGTGRIIADSSIADALYRLGVPADFRYTGPEKDAEVLFTHRRTEDSDIYLLNSLGAQARSITASFRVTGRVPQLWRADTGRIEPLSYRISQGRTHVPLTFDPHDAVFVVFRKKSSAPSLEIPPPTVETVLAVEGAWQLSFPPGLGAPAQARFERLQSLTDSAHAGIKYFSGTVTYTKTLQATVDASQPGARLYLDLGTVREVAEVIVNGKSMGVAWKPPYRVDVTPALRTGENRLEIKVSNLWRNRMIGDKQPGATPIAYVTHDPFKADSPLLPSGLLGPVSLLQEK